MALALLAPAAHAAFCSSSPDPGDRTNDFPIIDEELTFVRANSNAALYQAGPANARFDVVHVYGTAYEMGKAQGELMKDEIRKFMEGTFDYLIGGALENFGDRLPPALQALLVDKGINAVLDATAHATAPFTPQSYYDEVQGLADGSGVSYETILRLNLFPEVTKASCSFFGAWGEASSGGRTYQLRALDYITDAPSFTDYPQVTVYHPSWEGGVAHASVAWPATVGILTGYTANQIGISEIGVSFADDSFGQVCARRPLPETWPELPPPRSSRAAYLETGAPCLVPPPRLQSWRLPGALLSHRARTTRPRRR